MLQDDGIHSKKKKKKTDMNILISQHHFCWWTQSIISHDKFAQNDPGAIFQYSTSHISYLLNDQTSLHYDKVSTAPSVVEENTSANTLPLDSCTLYINSKHIGMRQNGCHFAEDISFSSMKFAVFWLDPINNKPALVHIMAWCQTGD